MSFPRAGAGTRWKRFAGKIELAGRRTLCQTTDITSRKSIETLRDQVMEYFGRVDILVNAAGITFRKPTLEVSEDEWEELFDTDLTGVLRACQAFHAALKASGHGRVVNIASLGSFVAFNEVAAYCAA